MRITKMWKIAVMTLIAVAAVSSVEARRPVRVIVRPVRVVQPLWVSSPALHATPVVTVRSTAFGRVDFNVHPSQSRVFVDGVYIGIADDFNGGLFGSTATLRAGTHHVKIVSPDGRVVTRKIYVMAGKELNFDLDF